MEPTGNRVETELGPIFIVPHGLRSAFVHAPHLTVDGLPLRAEATLTSSNGLDFDLIPHYDGKTFHTEAAITAILVSGRTADLVVRGRLAQVIVPAVRKFAHNNRGILLEAERNQLQLDIGSLEAESAKVQRKLEEKRRDLAAIEAQIDW